MQSAISLGHSEDIDSVKPDEAGVWLYGADVAITMGAVATSRRPTASWAVIESNTARLGSDDYLVSVKVTGGDFVTPENEATLSRLVMTADSFQSLNRVRWAAPVSDAWTPTSWDRPGAAAFKSRFSGALNKLRSTLGLESNWDSYGGEPPKVSTVARSFMILGGVFDYFETRGQALPEPFVAPVPDGRVQLEWEAGMCELEVTVDEKGALEYLIARGDDDDSFVEGTAASGEELGAVLLSNLFGRDG